MTAREHNIRALRTFVSACEGGCVQGKIEDLYIAAHIALAYLAPLKPSQSPAASADEWQDSSKRMGTNSCFSSITGDLCPSALFPWGLEASLPIGDRGL